MSLLQLALEAIELLTTDNSSEQAQAAAADARIKLANAMAVEPFAYITQPTIREKAMSLPLPEPSFEWPSLCKYNESELEAYGQACREAALEEAASICNGEQWHNSARPVDYIEAFNDGCGDCEAAIRRLK